MVIITATKYTNFRPNLLEQRIAEMEAKTAKILASIHDVKSEHNEIKIASPLLSMLYILFYDIICFSNQNSKQHFNGKNFVAAINVRFEMSYKFNI